MIEGLGVRKRYGYQIAKFPHGTWFWSPPLQCIDFVPKGRQTSSDGRSLPVAKNDLNGAIRAVLRVELARRGEEWR